jgi:FG-GAP-like repeat
MSPSGRLRARVRLVAAGLVVAVAAIATGCTTTPPPAAFTRVVIDAATPGSLVEKAMADFNRDGRLDVAVGYRKSAQGAGGIYWHAFPASGRATDPWVKRTVLTPTDAYEDMVAHDVNRDGWVDLIASVDDQIRWFRNPGTGTTWTATTIGRSVGRGDMVVGDLDGDGRADVVTNSDIFFQDSPATWVRKGLGDSTVGIALFDSGSGLGSIDIVRSSPTAPYDVVWMQNPRTTGGNARTGTWATRRIGPGYVCTTRCNLVQVATMATGDMTGDGRMDVVIGHGEGGVPQGPTGVRLFVAPANRASTWAERPVDPNYDWTHNLRIVDMDGNGTRDIVAAEEDQSDNRRLGIFTNDGSGTFRYDLIAAGVGGHNVEVGDVDGDGDLDVVNSPHGWYGDDNPLVVYLNAHG